MKICVFGAGAIGGLFGVRLARAGAQVSVVARGTNAAALRARGWRLQSGEAVISALVHVAQKASELGPQDLVIVAVKAPALPSVAAAIAPLLGPQTMVLTAMNGVPWWFFERFGGALQGTRLACIDPDGRIASAIPADHIIGCVVHLAASAPEPGLTRHQIGNRLIIGDVGGKLRHSDHDHDLSRPVSTTGARIQVVAALLAEAGFEVDVSTCIQRDIWYKLWGNMTMNPVSALTGATLDRILDDPAVIAFCLAVMREAAAIGSKIGCPIAESGEDRNAVTRKLGAVKTSMLQDLEAGRAVEIDALLTAVQEIGVLVNQPTPSLDVLLGLARLQARVRGLYPA